LHQISKSNNQRGWLPQHDPAKNKLRSEVSKAVNSALEANLEHKLCNYSGASSVNASGTILCVTANLVRGDASVNECTGILIKPKQLEIRLAWSQSGAGFFNTVRAIVFRWHDASTPTGAGILQTTASAFAPLSTISWVNHRKITILDDRMVSLYDRGAAIALKQTVMNVSPGKAPIQLPLSGAGAVPQMDGLYLLLISDDSFGTIPVCDVYMALKYTDA